MRSPRRNVSHEYQKKAWEKEHAEPSALPQMDSQEVSGGVRKFYEFLREKGGDKMTGLEMGCGKGRNIIWLAKQNGVEEVFGFDFSKNAIEEARLRAENAYTRGKVYFAEADATLAWPYGDANFDFAIDCFAASDIETKEGREFAAREFIRVLKPGGYLLVYELSTDDEYHKMMLEQSPAEEFGTFINPNGKLEKVFTRDELLEMYKDMTPVLDERVEKTAEFYGTRYSCRHFWTVFQK